MNNKKMKAELQKVDKLSDRVAELEKQFDMGNVGQRISLERVQIVDKIGRKHGK